MTKNESKFIGMGDNGRKSNLALAIESRRLKSACLIALWTPTEIADAGNSCPKLNAPQPIQRWLNGSCKPHASPRGLTQSGVTPRLTYETT